MVQHDKSSANLVADTARELSAPVAAILEHADLLEETALSAEQHGLLDVIRRSGQNLKALVDDLRSLTSPVPKQVIVGSDPFDVHESIENAVSVLMPSIYRQGLDLVLMIYRDVPTRLIGDAARLQQVLSQLVLMAVRSSIEGSITLRVMLESETAETAKLRFNLTLGLGAQGVEAITDPADSFPSLSPGHAQRLVAMLGGEMLTTPGPEGGSTFLLPLGKPAHTTPALVWPGLAGRNIRIFDNDQSSRRALQHHLEAWGVSNPQSGGLASLSLPGTGGSSNDCVILGLRPSEIDRSELAAILGSMRARRTPTLCLVASFDEQVHRRLREMGATACLPKSTNRLTLYRVLCRLIGTVGGGQERRLTYLDLPVLVADDVEANRRIMKIMLEQLGAKPVLASGGGEALQLWATHRYPLVLMDVRMPDLDGATVARNIRNLEANGASSVIVGVTAALDGPLRRQLLDAGMNDCILKPIDKHSLTRDLNPWIIPPLQDVQQTPATSAASALADLSAAQELLTQNPELAKLLLESLPLQLHSLEEAVRNGKSATINEELHQLHGTAAFYRLEGLKQIAGSLEAQARKERMLIPDQLPPLRDSVNGVIESLRRFVKI